MGAELRDIYDRLWTAYGPQHWWPADSPTEVVIGAILTQNTAWTNVERAIANLRAAGCLDWRALRDIPEPRLARLIRPSGTFRVKAKRLKGFAGALWEEHGGSIDTMFSGPLDRVRRRLLAISGIGPETADSILLYAGGRRSFVVDAYTRRVLRRHGLIDGKIAYEGIQQLFHREMPPNAQVYNDYHALLVTVAKKHCRAKPRCKGCPLADLPHDETLGA